MRPTTSRPSLWVAGAAASEPSSGLADALCLHASGVADLVADGVNGYKIDVSEIERITNKIDEILTDRELYVALSGEALRRSRQFSEQSMIESIKNIIIA